ncbi:MAG: hypothetical protein MZV63_06475 [Marinilabiliales bacterium]|nr:hypothetical protein [Marinilabiliales bacterium]
MVTEALALALAGGALGTVLAWVGIELFDRAVAGTNPPFFMLFRLDAPILLFILAISIAVGSAGRGHPGAEGVGAGRERHPEGRVEGSSSLRIGRLSNVLVVGEIAMSMGLLVAAGLMTKSIATLRNLDLGFDADARVHGPRGALRGRVPGHAGARGASTRTCASGSTRYPASARRAWA